MNPDTPLVSVLIVSWNRREQLVRAIESVLSQTYKHTEIVVVDSASSDGTPEMLGSRYPGIRVVRLSKNIGCPSARNIGFTSCSGIYIYQLDDDGWLDEHAIEWCVKAAQSDELIGVTMSQIVEIENGNVVRRRPVGLSRAVYQADFSGGCSMFRTSMLQIVGGYPDDFFRSAEESDFALRLINAGFVSYFEPKSVMYHEPAQANRDLRLIRYYALRNTNKSGLRLWPFPWCVVRPFVNLMWALVWMVSMRYPTLPFAILRELGKDILTLHRTRKPVSRSSMRLFRKLIFHPSETNPLKAIVDLPNRSK